jgi:glycosyltransferase involved in cell wall biosynthesis
MAEVGYPKKILIVSDSVSSKSGLARIARDLAQRIHLELHDKLHLATAGWNGNGLIDFPWKDYPIHEIDNWFLPELPKIAKHFAGNDDLIVLFISDPSRLGWFAHPDWCPYPELAEWARSPKIKKWIYAPIDAEGPNGKLSFKLDYILKGFDRVLNYSKFSAQVTGYPDHIPHGIDTEIWKPRDKRTARNLFTQSGFPLTDENFVVGIVATNQPRKDWSLGFETCKILIDAGLDVRLWCHTDILEKHWDLGALVHDFGLHNRVCMTTQEIPDATMNWFYSACDVTLGIGLGEGFGYPLAESIASGTPVVHGNYAGGTEFLAWPSLVNPVAWRYEGPYCCKRPVFSAQGWADTAVVAAKQIPVLPDYIKWENAWPLWAEWLLK